MKRVMLMLTLGLVFALTSCGEKTEYMYNISYTDGTEEVIVTDNELEFSGSADCVETCGCSGDRIQRCGVKKFDLIETKAVATEGRFTDAEIAKASNKTPQGEVGEIDAVEETDTEQVILEKVPDDK